jgi:hypothetical protein
VWLIATTAGISLPACIQLQPCAILQTRLNQVLCQQCQPWCLSQQALLFGKQQLLGYA